MSHTTRIIGITSLLTLLACLLGLAGLLYFLEVRKSDLREMVTQLETKEAEESQLASLTSLMTETKADRTLLESYVLTEAGVIDFLSSIEGLARRNGLSIETKSVDVAEGGEAAGFETLRVDLDLTGSLPAISRMIVLLENVPQHLLIDNLSLTRISDNGEWQASVVLFVTKYKQQ